MGKPIFRCELCKVALCKTAKEKSHKNMSCFYILHNSVDLMIEHNKIKQAYKKCNATPNNATKDRSSEDEAECKDKVDEGLINCTQIENLENKEKEKSKSNDESGVGEQYRNSTLERRRRQRLCDNNSDGPLDIASMARLSCAKNRIGHIEQWKQGSDDNRVNEDNYDDDCDDTSGNS